MYNLPFTKLDGEESNENSPTQCNGKKYKGDKMNDVGTKTV